MKTPVVSVVFGLLSLAASAQTFTKVADLFTSVNLGIGVGGNSPRDVMVLVTTATETNFYFTTENGGAVDRGTLSRFNPFNSNVTEVVSLDNATGQNPLSVPVQVGDRLYFTTQSGGSGNRGTILYYNLTNGVLSNVFNFAADGLATGRGPAGGFTVVGDHLYFLTVNGGTNTFISAGPGIIGRFNWVTETFEKMLDLDGTNSGCQPFEGFTRDGDFLYYTTFTGGTNSGSGFPNGAGTLCRYSLVSNSVTKLLDLATNHTAFPAHNPLLVGSNLFFNTVGNNANPGALNRYNLSNGVHTVLHRFLTNNAAAGGRQPYGRLLEHRGYLYLTTLNGGFIGGITTNQLGTIGRFHLATGEYQKLLNLDRTNYSRLGSASFNGGTLFTNADGREVIYFPIRNGGDPIVLGGSPGTLNGTILRFDPEAELTLTATAAGANVNLAWFNANPPYQLQGRPSYNSGGWTNIGPAGLATNATVPVGGSNQFYRVILP